MSTKLNFLIERDEAGFHVSCPEVPGCDARGRTLDEVMATVCDILGRYWIDRMVDEPQLFDGPDLDLSAETVEVIPIRRPSGTDPR